VNERNGFGCNGRIEDRMARGVVAGRHAMNGGGWGNDRSHGIVEISGCDLPLLVDD
jgi:hypothetical protein